MIEPPRLNGELVFEQPWQARAFGLVMTLVEGGAFTYEQFQERLVAQVPVHAAYYDAWLAALEDALASRGLVSAGDVSERAHELSHRGPGHDH